MDDHDWNLFVDLEKSEVKEVKKVKKVKEVNEIKEVNETYLNQWTNKIPVKKLNGNCYFLYTIDEGVEQETDFFKKSPIKEKNMYKDKFAKYILNTK